MQIVNYIVNLTQSLTEFICDFLLNHKHFFRFRPVFHVTFFVAMSVSFLCPLLSYFLYRVRWTNFQIKRKKLTHVCIFNVFLYFILVSPASRHIYYVIELHTKLNFCVTVNVRSINEYAFKSLKTAHSNLLGPPN